MYSSQLSPRFPRKEKNNHKIAFSRKAGSGEVRSKKRKTQSGKLVLKSYTKNCGLNLLPPLMGFLFIWLGLESFDCGFQILSAQCGRGSRRCRFLRNALNPSLGQLSFRRSFCHWDPILNKVYYGSKWLQSPGTGSPAITLIRMPYNDERRQ